MKQYVQHISGQGEKWLVEGENNFGWIIGDKAGHHYVATLPKSEYRLCDPPEVWQDVTGECVFKTDVKRIFHESSPGSYGGVSVIGDGCLLFAGYRFRKIQYVSLGKERGDGYAFIVEKLVKA
jgi:hypothetical protein